MKLNDKAPQLHCFEGASGGEVFLTVNGSVSDSVADSARDLFDEVAETLVEHAIEPIQEKIYGRCSDRAQVLRIREESYRAKGLDPTLPVTYLQGSPPAGKALAGFQLWGLTSGARDTSLVTTVVLPDGLVGRRFERGGVGFLYLPAVHGMDGEAAGTASQQAQRMFEKLGGALQFRGLSVAHMVRTWIYLDRLLDWYGEFNRLRTDYYQGQGLRTLQGEPYFPASTGIQGRSSAEECVMDVLAAENAGKDHLRPIRSTSRQGRAYGYGSSFSRGVVLALEGRQTVFVSGTASIDAEGRTVHDNDRESQCHATLLNVAALLEDQGGSLLNICSATLFCKDEATLLAYQEVTARLRIPSFPTVVTIADICRPDLLVELEAVAVIESVERS